MCAPVSNIKPPPEISGCWRHLPAVPGPQPCHTVALMLSSVPSSPERNISTALRIWGERLPLKATTSSRPVRSRASIRLRASAAFMTIGFSKSTSSPASRQARA